MKRWKRMLALALAAITIFMGMPNQAVWAAEATDTEDIVSTETADCKQDEPAEETVVEDSTEAVETTETEETTEAAVTTEEAETTEEEETVADELLYLVVDSSNVMIGDTQNIVVGIGDGQSEITQAVLNYHRESDGIQLSMSASVIDKEAILFSKEYADAADAGIYILDSITYTKNDISSTIDFTEQGITAKYGVETQVETTPDAEVVEETEPELDVNVVTTDENGVQVSQNSLASALSVDDIVVNQATKGAGKGPFVVVLDPGHDATHGGTHSAGGLQEADLNLKIALYCKEELAQYSGVQVYMTRTTSACPHPGTTSGDDNAARVAYAKSVNADVYVSIHLNSGASSAHGAEVYYPNGNYRPEVGAEGKELAQSILDHLVALGLADRGVKIRMTGDGSTYPDGSYSDYYGVIRRCKLEGIPAVIVEHAFMSSESDVANFLSSDEKLKALGVADAAGIAQHFGLVRDGGYGAVFDATYYAEHNADVKAVFGTDQTKLLNHFVNYGMAEGRQACATFDVYSYRNRYQDLRTAYGNDLKKYYMHYIQYGKAEGRIATGAPDIVNAVTVYKGTSYAAVYDYQYYINKYSDVKQKFAGNDMGALEYFVNYGMAQGQQACATFDVKSYRYQYADLRRAYGNDLTKYYMHFINYGKKEGRAGTGTTILQNAMTVYNGVNYAAVYDYNYYLSKNPDVKSAFKDDDAAVLAHFVNYGMKEGRQASASFDVKSYRNKYGDLRQAYGKDYTKYYLHYINYGKKEGRIATGTTTLQGATTTYNGVNYAAVYDYNYYISKNPDVKSAFGDDDVAVLAHFVNYGMKEGRQASASFNVTIYKNNYGDLRAAYGDNLKSYYLHYINYGKKEGRQAVTQYYTSIMRTSTTTVDQMVRFYQASGKVYPTAYASTEAPDIRAFCQIYYDECIAEGVDPAVAFCQSMKETGYLQFGGVVQPGQFNFAGMGVTGEIGVTGDSYSSIREGIRAHVQHLKAYAVKNPTFTYPIVDKRYSSWFANNVSGTAPYIEWLGIKENPNGKGWASAVGYGYSIINDYMAKLYKS